jgi:putative hydrolase of the HAD superfamily
MGIRLVVFDLDDTLFREADFARSGFAAVAADLRRRLGLRADLAGWMTRRYRRGLRANMFDALSAHFRLGLSRRELARLVKLYRNHLPAIRPCRGVPALLAALRRRGFKLALLSDGYMPCQRNKFQALGLERYFDKVVFSEELGRRAWKPSPKGFELLQRHFRLAGSACVYVGDNPAKDFIAPNRLGWRTIRWRRPASLHYDQPAAGQPGPPARPSRTVRTAPQLLGVIGQLK